MAIVIEGENFLALPVQRLGGGPPVEVDARFELRLGDMPLEDVVRESERRLRAVVPPGLAPGWHALTVVGPLGRGAVLPEAYRSLEPIPAQEEGRLSGMVRVTPAEVRVGGIVTLELRLRNEGQATVRDVTVTVPVNAGDGQLQLSSPLPAPMLLPGGAEHLFTWTYEATAPGQARFQVNASGTCAQSGEPVRLETLLSEPVTVKAQPTPASLVGKGLAPARLKLGESVTLVVEITNTGMVTANDVRPVPVQVSGRGGIQGDAEPVPASADIPGGETRTFQATVTGTAEGPVLIRVAARGKDAMDGSTVSMPVVDLSLEVQREVTQLADDPFGDGTAFSFVFRYVDLHDAPLGGQTKGASSALFFQGRLYLGFPDTGGNRPYLVVLKKAPASAPGLDAQAPEDAVSLNAESMPGLGKGGSPSNDAPMQMIDAMAAFNERLYVTNNGGCIRSTTPTPGPHDDAPGHWAPCTPSLAAYTSRVSRTTEKTADLEPADKAVPGMAVFNGRLYLARNTTVGPQLFVCNPGIGGDPEQCEPEEWSLVAPNVRPGRDALLTQFDNPANTSLALLVATREHLYLGFDNAVDGLVLMRSEGGSPTSTADFRGMAGCVASEHASGCAGLGGNGLGVGATRIFDGAALSFDGADFVYLTAGTGASPVRVFRVPD